MSDRLNNLKAYPRNYSLPNKQGDFSSEMPTYQYRCPECGHEFEKFQTMTEEAISICPACKGKTQRVISGGAGVIFKGSGFYITDYRSEAYKADAAKDTPAESKKDDSSGKSKSDTTGKSTGSGNGSSGVGNQKKPGTDSSS